jgi:peptidylprolyl isomerase
MKTAMIVVGLVVVGAVVALIAVDSPSGGGKQGEFVTTASGLKYVDNAFGSGKAAKPGDQVAVHYTGTLEDGAVFDSSRKRGDPIVFTLGKREVIAGWDEGIAGMKEGGKRKLVIPPELAYGRQGRPGIPPNSVLLFEVELVKVN